MSYVFDLSDLERIKQARNGQGKKLKLLLDPHGRPTVTAGSDHCFRTCCPYVRSHFSKSRKTKQILSENSVHYLRGCGSGRVDHWWYLSSSSYFYGHKQATRGRKPIWSVIKAPKMSCHLTFDTRILQKYLINDILDNLFHVWSKCQIVIAFWKLELHLKVS